MPTIAKAAADVKQFLQQFKKVEALAEVLHDARALEEEVNATDRRKRALTEDMAELNADLDAAERRLADAETGVEGAKAEAHKIIAEAREKAERSLIDASEKIKRERAAFTGDMDGLRAAAEAERAGHAAWTRKAEAERDALEKQLSELRAALAALRAKFSEEG